MKHSYQNGVVTNTVHRYKITHGFYYAKTYEHKHKISSRRADNIRPYRIVQMMAILRSGILVFYCTNYLHELTAEALGYKVTSLIIR